MELSDLTGEHVLTFVPRTDVKHPFDADASGTVFGLDNSVYMVFEDPSDGYRSHAGPLMQYEGSAYSIGGFYPDYIREKVLCTHRSSYEYGGESDVLEIRSAETGALVFSIGTENTDDYYPYFYVAWNPEGLSANGKARL